MKARDTVGSFMVAAALLLPPRMAGAESDLDLRLFSISKSENHNQVVYAIHVDRDCQPVGPAPVHAYWQNLERGPTNTSPLLWIEQPAYGMSSQVTEDGRGPDGSRQVRVRLRALPERPIVIRTSRTDGSCRAEALATVAATPVTLFNVHARLRRIFGIESITISGRRSDTTAIVRETLQP